jgi:hypothetical protein
MPIHRILLLTILVAAVSSKGLSQCEGSMTISNPVEGQSVQSHFQIDAIASSACSITTMHVYIDNRLQFAQYAQAALSGKFNAGAGRHLVVVQAWNSAGKVFNKAVHINVAQQVPATCVPGFDPNVRVCQPVNLLETKGAVLIHAAARSSASAVVSLKAFAGGALRAVTYNENAGELEAALSLPRGLQNINVVARSANGLEFQNQTNVQVVSSSTACQLPFISAIAPGPGDAPDFPPFLAAADAAGCQISTFQVYVDNQLFYSQANQKIFEGRLVIVPGQHSVVLQAWNSNGGVAKKTITINVIGSPEPTCLPDSDPGVTLCQLEPVENSYVTIFAGTPAAPSSPVTALRIYVDNAARATFYRAAAERGITFLRMSRGIHKVTAVAWTQKGAVVSDTRTVTVP